MDLVDEHPVPTDATVKELYAHAFRCAHPDCRKPLYTQDDETGVRTLNSRVAHIHARRRGGPRWIEMASIDNRASTNLVLLCIEHSYEVDDHSERFPADLLRQRKAEQLAEYRWLLEVWRLTDDKVAEAQRAPFQVQAQNSRRRRDPRLGEATRSPAARSRTTGPYAATKARGSLLLLVA